MKSYNEAKYKTFLKIHLHFDIARVQNISMSAVDSYVVNIYSDVCRSILRKVLH